MENNEAMVNTEEVETVVPSDSGDSMEVTLNKFFSRSFTSMPMFLRVKYLVDTIDKIPDGDLSFSRVNSLLHANINEGDFNIIPDEIKSKDDIIKLYNQICNAVSGLSVWCKRVCKDCGKEFNLYLSEVDFYRGKGFALPKRCKNCVKNRKESQQV